ncbi:MAG: hydrolase [Bdellovibrionaceae bacterium]|jgi:competence protein ComEC|nr:hydrolase [Pseudobdellovibrionaceae bacterium]
MSASYFWGILFWILLTPTPLVVENDFLSRLVVWNVGQGQWVTWATRESCLHFDLGGEYMPAKKIKNLCAYKENKLFLSHWDWDHISFVRKMKFLVSSFCLALRPAGTSSSFKMKIVDEIPTCDSSFESISNLWTNSKARNSNDRSHVLVVKNKILIPGDSTLQQEKYWHRNPSVEPISILVLGHHGSRTSTSEELLNATSHLKMAIASARHKRYGHPHVEVVLRLKKNQVPLLKTEDWGNIWINTP